MSDNHEDKILADSFKNSAVVSYEFDVVLLFRDEII